jgi:hypothetical protein
VFVLYTLYVLQWGLQTKVLADPQATFILITDINQQGANTRFYNDWFVLLCCRQQMN